MHYAELKEIIKHLKKTLPCNTCNQRFADEDFKVLSTFNHEALFHFHCLKCNNQLLVHAAIVEQTPNGSKLNIQAQKTDKISYNDFLDIHNFLNQFNGDFKELFLQ